MKYLLVILFLSFSAQADIIGGKEISIIKTPWIVGLKTIKNSSGDGVLFCSGTIVDSYHILTAAHCVKRYEKRYNLINVYAGAAHTGDQTKLQRMSLIEKIFIHENSERHDIAIIRLTERIEFNDFRKPISLIASNTDLRELVGKYINAAGWGRFSTQSKAISRNLRQVFLKLKPLFENKSYWSTKRKNDEWGKAKKEVFEGHLIFNEKNKTTCEGDSGGPLVYQEAGETPFIIGITSWGNSSNCKWSNFGVNIQYYLNWINEIIK